MKNRNVVRGVTMMVLAMGMQPVQAQRLAPSGVSMQTNAARADSSAQGWVPGIVEIPKDIGIGGLIGGSAGLLLALVDISSSSSSSEHGVALYVLTAGGAILGGAIGLVVGLTRTLR